MFTFGRLQGPAVLVLVLDRIGVRIPHLRVGDHVRDVAVHVHAGYTLSLPRSLTSHLKSSTVFSFDSTPKGTTDSEVRCT
jgi:hypothetical protein